MIEHNLIKVLLNKQTYDSYRNFVKFEEPELQQILSSLDSYWLTYEKEPTVDDLETHFRASYPQLSEKKYALFKAIFDKVRESSAQPEIVHSLLVQFQKRKLLTELAEKALAARETQDVSVEELQGLTEVLSSGKFEEVQAEDAVDFVTTDLQELKERTVGKHGLRWRLNILNSSLGSLRVGDFGFIFARPETGKTTFLASEVTHMAMQAQTPVLWFNNEEQGEKVMTKIYQSALGIDKATLFANTKVYQEEFNRLLNGRLLMVDQALITKGMVERLCEKYKPSLIVIDQLDKIKGFKGDRNDLEMGAIYQWARELAKTYGPVIGVCQADGSGDGVKWLTMANVADAKTAKQAEADWIIGIGKTYDPDFEYRRFINISKNKLDGDDDTVPEWRHNRCEVTIRPEIGRYED